MTNIVSCSDLWCAKLYEEDHFGGWVHEVAITEYDSLYDTYKNDKVSSYKVRTGCTFTAYHNIHLDALMFSASTDTLDKLVPTLEEEYDDKMTSFSCECSGKQHFPIAL